MITELHNRVIRHVALRVIRIAGLLSCLCLLYWASLAGTTASASTAPAGKLTIHSFLTLGGFSTAHNAECEATIGNRIPNCDTYQITVTNSGSQPVEGPITITDLLPAGLEAKRVEFFWSGTFNIEHVNLCETEAVPIKCTFPIELAPDATLEMTINTIVKAGAKSGELNVVHAVASGEPEVSLSSADVIDPAALSFGVGELVPYIADVDGTPDTQAGGHPYEFTTRIDLNSVIRSSPETTVTPTSVRDVKDVVVDLPLGFLGGGVATPRCTLSQVASTTGCPADTIVGHIISEPVAIASANSPIYNIVPEHGVAAEFGFLDALENVHVIYASVAPSPSGYVLRATSREVSQIPLTDITANFYGVPAERDESGVPAAMFTNPSHCSGEPLVTSIHVDSWLNPGRFNTDGSPDLTDPSWVSTDGESPPVTGCNRLRFAPESFTVQPDTATTDSPSGLNFDLKLPQTEEPGTLTTPPLRNATVTLPVGLIVNPSAASGLSGCSTAQIGWLGGSLNDFNSAPSTCPDASKVGTVEITTPLLEGALIGSVYLATQNENPFHSLLAGYVVIDDKERGVVVKIAGKLTLDPHTGQISGVFNENPQLPFSDLKLRFFGGPRGELATPESCSSFVTTGLLSPWSAPDSGANASVSDSFSINVGCDPGFSPSFTAGTTSPHAGGYSTFQLSLARQDSEQEISGLTVTLPPGLLAKIAGVSECPEAAIAAASANPSAAVEQANPSCPANSRLGSVRAGAGAGPNPLFLSGKAYLTGPYKGAPYGLAVVVPAAAGPFDLGNVVVRSQLRIDPADGHVTVVTDPLPTIVDAAGADGLVDGFPVRMRQIDVTIDRANFTLNPTNCNSTAIRATLTSTSGQSASTSSPFEVDGCQALQFKPRFAVSTTGRDSKANGAGLRVAVNSTPGQANFGKVKVSLPKQLPSRLSTLQKACTAATFAVNPASCPPESLVGKATAVSPLLSNPLTGPAYIVSYGGAKFPDLEIVLQGEGITLILDGNTDIKNGITTSTFNAIPDAPVTSFNLDLPQGPHSILGTNLPRRAKYNMCGQTLNMPTTLIGQNNAVVRQTTHVTISGCPKPKHHGKAKKSRKAAHKAGEHRRHHRRHH